MSVSVPVLARIFTSRRRSSNVPWPPCASVPRSVSPHGEASATHNSSTMPSVLTRFA